MIIIVFPVLPSPRPPQNCHSRHNPVVLELVGIPSPHLVEPVVEVKDIRCWLGCILFEYIMSGFSETENPKHTL